MSVLLELLDQKVLRIIKVLVKNKNEQFHIKKLSQTSKVSLATTFRILNKLVKLEIVQVNIIGKFKLYKLNKSYLKELKGVFLK